MGNWDNKSTYTTGNEFFGVNILEREMEKMKDENRDIRSNKNIEWMLPTFDDNCFGIFWLQGCMMMHLMM
jgi:hypothetical protein